MVQSLLKDLTKLFLTNHLCRLKDDYLEAVDGIQRHLLRYSEPNRMAFVGALPNAASFGHVRNEMVRIEEYHSLDFISCGTL